MEDLFEEINLELEDDDEEGEEVDNKQAEVLSEESSYLLSLPTYLKAPSKVTLQEVPVQVFYVKNSQARTEVSKTRKYCFYAPFPSNRGKHI